MKKYKINNLYKKTYLIIFNITIKIKYVDEGQVFLIWWHWKNIEKYFECFFAVACGRKWNDQNIKINRLTIKFQSREHVRDWKQQILIKFLGILRRPSGKPKRGINYSIGPKIYHGRQ